MPTISKNKKDKISEHIVSILFDNFPQPLFTSQIAKELARDEEFTKDLLKELNNQHLTIPIQKNPKGKDYKRRIRWRLSNEAHNSLKMNKFL